MLPSVLLLSWGVASLPALDIWGSIALVSAAAMFFWPTVFVVGTGLVVGLYGSTFVARGILGPTVPAPPTTPPAAGPSPPLSLERAASSEPNPGVSTTPADAASSAAGSATLEDPAPP